MRQASAAATFSGSADLDCDLLVLGAGPSGYSAAFRAADLGLPGFCRIGGRTACSFMLSFLRWI